MDFRARVLLARAVSADYLVPRVDLWKFRREMSRETFHKIHRAMLAAGTANGDRQITAVGAYQLGYPMFQEADDVLEHLRHLWMPFEIFDHRWIASREAR